VAETAHELAGEREAREARAQLIKVVADEVQAQLVGEDVDDKAQARLVVETVAEEVQAQQVGEKVADEAQRREDVAEAAQGLAGEAVDDEVRARLDEGVVDEAQARRGRDCGGRLGPSASSASTLRRRGAKAGRSAAAWGRRRVRGPQAVAPESGGPRANHCSRESRPTPRARVRATAPRPGLAQGTAAMRTDGAKAVAHRPPCTRPLA